MSRENVHKIVFKLYNGQKSITVSEYKVSIWIFKHKDIKIICCYSYIVGIIFISIILFQIWFQMVDLG